MQFVKKTYTRKETPTAHNTMINAVVRLISTIFYALSVWRGGSHI